MSTLAYGALTKAREEAPAPAEPRESSLSGVKDYLDAAAALIPAEVLAFHALALQFTTDTVEAETDSSVPPESSDAVSTESGESVTVVTDPGVLRAVFIALIIAAPVLYWVGHRKKHKKWHRADWLRLCIPAAAFVVWTMLQKSTAFDAIWPSLEEAPRFLVAAGVAAALGILARELAFSADGEHP